MKMDTDEIFLLVKPSDIGYGPVSHISSRSLIPQYLRDGWIIYRLDGLQRVFDAHIELKMDSKDVWCEPPESSESDY